MTVRRRLSKSICMAWDSLVVAIRRWTFFGCTDFCLSGYPHDVAAEQFGRWVMPYFSKQMANAAE